MEPYKLPYQNLNTWTLAMISDLINSNASRARKYDMRVACNYKYKKFYFKFYLGENVVLEQEAMYQEAHYVIAEMHKSFHEYLNVKDQEYAEFCEQEKKNWIINNLR